MFQKKLGKVYPYHGLFYQLQSEPIVPQIVKSLFGLSQGGMMDLWLLDSSNVLVGWGSNHNHTVTFSIILN